MTKSLETRLELGLWRDSIQYLHYHLTFPLIWSLVCDDHQPVLNHSIVTPFLYFSFLCFLFPLRKSPNYSLVVSWRSPCLILQGAGLIIICLIAFCYLFLFLFYLDPPLQAQGILPKRRWKSVRARKNGKKPKNPGLLNIIGLTHIWTHKRSKQHAQGWHESVTDGIPRAERRSEHPPHA